MEVAYALRSLSSLWLCSFSFHARAPSKTAQAFRAPVDAAEDLPEISDTLFSVCPRGGCEAHLSPEQRAAFHALHSALVTAVRVHEPVRRDLSASPLVLQWRSPSTGDCVQIVVAFNVRKAPWDMVLLQLSKEPPGAEAAPYTMQLTPAAADAQHSCVTRSDMDLCRELAEKASDWRLFRARVGPASADLGTFRIVSREELTQEFLQQAALEMKEIQRAARAAKLAQGLAVGKKRRARGPRKPRQPRGAPERADAPDEAWDWHDSDASGSASGMEQHEDLGDAEGLPSGPSTVGRRPSSDVAADPATSAPGGGAAEPAASRGAKRKHQARAIPWGPFQIAPIVAAAGQVGWGAICGQHCDRGNRLSCKKAVTRSAGLSDSDCVLRLKRWLMAGVDDADWPLHRRRSHHVDMGGKGLAQFSNGPSEAELDAQADRLVQTAG